MERGEASSSQEIILTTLLRQVQDIKKIKSILHDMATALDKLQVAQGQTQIYAPTSQTNASNPVAQPQKPPSHPLPKPKKEHAQPKHFTPLPLGQLLSTLVERKLITLRGPTPLQPLAKRNHNYKEHGHYAFHQDPGHSTNHCITLKHVVEDLINEGKLDYVPGVEYDEEQNSHPEPLSCTKQVKTSSSQGHGGNQKQGESFPSLLHFPGEPCVAPKKGAFNSCIALLHIWLVEHIPSIASPPTRPIQFNSVVLQFLVQRHKPASTDAELYLAHLQTLKEDDIIWRPTWMPRQIQPRLSTVRRTCIILAGLSGSAPYAPLRVLRQLGYAQFIPTWEPMHEDFIDFKGTSERMRREFASSWRLSRWREDENLEYCMTPQTVDSYDQWLILEDQASSMPIPVELPTPARPPRHGTIPIAATTRPWVDTFLHARMSIKA
ncbi:hypothetical protein HHK36_017820 [Tetracentron sinense]|uniref:Aminotransferase-like plant mobile domain-containing protein n=1 Tax=Tetracentron sinense TaxID=13715 RepID=A0A834YXU6_TETSI|nr:hypothetical protein HHK36_017820 [Tetracentron sinense]